MFSKNWLALYLGATILLTTPISSFATEQSSKNWIQQIKAVGTSEEAINLIKEERDRIESHFKGLKGEDKHADAERLAELKKFHKLNADMLKLIGGIEAEKLSLIDNGETSSKELEELIQQYQNDVQNYHQVHNSNVEKAIQDISSQIESAHNNANIHSNSVDADKSDNAEDETSAPAPHETVEPVGKIKEELSKEEAAAKKSLESQGILPASYTIGGHTTYKELLDSHHKEKEVLNRIEKDLEELMKVVHVNVLHGNQHSLVTLYNILEEHHAAPYSNKDHVDILSAVEDLAHNHDSHEAQTLLTKAHHHGWLGLEVDAEKAEKLAEHFEEHGNHAINHILEDAHQQDEDEINHAYALVNAHKEAVISKINENQGPLNLADDSNISIEAAPQATTTPIIMERAEEDGDEDSSEDSENEDQGVEAHNPNLTEGSLDEGDESADQESNEEDEDTNQ